MELTKGANAPVARDRVKVVLSWAGSLDVDVAALACASNGKVRSDEDFVFYNQPRHHSGALVYDGKNRGATSADTLRVDVSAVEAAVDKIVISASVDGGAFGQLSQLALTVQGESGETLIRYAIVGTSVETALIAGELYRRNGAWKFRAVGQGYSTGLRGIALDYGISVDDEPQTPPAPSTPSSSQYPTAPQQAYPPAPAPSYPSAPAYPPAPAPSYPSAPAYPPAPAQSYPPAAQHAYPPAPQPPVQSNYGPGPQHGGQPMPPPSASVPSFADMDSDAPEEEVTLQPFPTNNPYLKRIFTMKEFGRAPGRAIAVFRERVIDPEEKMIAAFKSKHGQYRWGYLVLTSHYLRWFQTLPTRDETFWGWDDVGMDGSVVVCASWQYQLKGFGAGRKFKALMLVLAQADAWDDANSSN